MALPELKQTARESKAATLDDESDDAEDRLLLSQAIDWNFFFELCCLGGHILLGQLGAGVPRNWKAAGCLTGAF